MFCSSLSQYNRRLTVEVSFGSVTIGGDNPVAVQSMANCSTLDTEACVAQIGAVHKAGGRIMRFTAPSMREGNNLGNIAEAARKAGYGDMALVADIHFTPDVAMIAAEHFDKVRINPGNYKNTDGELHRLVELCRSRDVALRIGVNHGSLAPHIVEQHGDTPQGMVASAMEFLRQCRNMDFHKVVVSIKSSNVRVMIHAYRLLATAMQAEAMHYPLHLGVTEAGDSLAARVKSAVGIGALLADGIGDTIRVSLTESPQNEIPVAQTLVSHFSDMTNRTTSVSKVTNPSQYSPYEYRRRESVAVDGIGGTNVPIIGEELRRTSEQYATSGEVFVPEGDCSAAWRAAILNLKPSDRRPVLLRKEYTESDFEQLTIKSAADFGMLFIDGLSDAIEITVTGSPFSTEQIRELELAILQSARVRISSTEYIACPGCGRTLYDLQSTLAAIKARTSHLKGLKIGVMGCIVNGPGEMADADYGYVGSGRGVVTIYKGREVVRRAVPQEQAIDALIDLIKECGDWKEAQQ